MGRFDHRCLLLVTFCRLLLNWSNLLFLIWLFSLVFLLLFLCNWWLLISLLVLVILIRATLRLLLLCHFDILLRNSDGILLKLRSFSFILRGNLATFGILVQGISGRIQDCIVIFDILIWGFRLATVVLLRCLLWLRVLTRGKRLLLGFFNYILVFNLLILHLNIPALIHLALGVVFSLV